MFVQPDPAPDPVPVPGWREFGIGIGNGIGNDPTRNVSGPRIALFTLLALPAVGFLLAADEPVIPSGFHEVVFSVSDLEGTADLYREVAGWEVVAAGAAEPALAAHWGLAHDQPVEEMLLRNPGTEHGWLRLVSFPGAEQRQIRSAAQPWDTGGIFDVNVRVVDIDAKFAELRRRGWQFQSEPVRFEFGPFVVREVLARGPDGVVLAMIERVEPPLEGWPELRELSHIFNSTQVVSDLEASLAFYREQLGFEVYLEHAGPSPQPGANVFGLPHDLAARIPRRIVILSPDGSNAGSVELIAFEGATGADFSELAVPPNLGILALRFPVADLEAYRTRLTERGVKPVRGPSKVAIEPYGEVEIMTVRAPEGAWLEFFQPRMTADAEED